jgi:Protein of unknown function (DUF3592)
LECLGNETHSKTEAVGEIAMTRRVLVPLAWVLLFCTFGAIGITTLDWFRYRHFANSGKPTTGHVEAKESENHRAIRYSYDVNGQSYSGLGSAGGINPEFDDLQVGSPVTLFYDREDPRRSLLDDPKNEFRSRTKGIMFLAFAGSTLSLIGLLRKRWL